MPKSRQRHTARQTRLATLGYNSYDAYLRSPQWRAVRARYYASDEPQECICGAIEGLHLHHLTYDRVGAEELTDLTPLCPKCHAMIHALEARGDIELDFAGFVSEHRARLYARDIAKKRAADEQERLRARLYKQMIWNGLPLEARLKYTRARARQRKINISSSVRLIDQRVQRIERLLGLGEYRGPLPEVKSIKPRLDPICPGEPFS